MEYEKTKGKQLKIATRINRVWWAAILKKPPTAIMLKSIPTNDQSRRGRRPRESIKIYAGKVKRKLARPNAVFAN